MDYILSIDQGTSSTRSIIFNDQAEVVGVAQKEHQQIYPQQAWVEHNPIEIKNSVLTTMSDAVENAKISWNEVKSIGIANQRETVVAWDRSSGEPLYNAIVWQCRRTATLVEKLKSDGYVDLFQHKTGLVLDAYFSGTKMKWLIDNSIEVKSALERNNLAFGTIDSWIIHFLTGEHKTDDSNASRTLLYNLKTGSWDDELCEILKIPIKTLPKIHANATNVPFGIYSHDDTNIPIRGVLGDQQSALFGQIGFNSGDIKTTYGTGNFILLNTGKHIPKSENGLLSTVGWKIGDKVTYALEGSVFVTGAAFQWLRDNLQIINSFDEIDLVSKDTSGSEGVYFVPALVGLGAPHWDSYARGMLIGLTHATNKSNIVNATIDSIAHQTQEIIELMALESNLDISKMRVDGGITKSNSLMQRQSDISQIKIEKPKNTETTALGAAMMAGLNLIWKDLDSLKNLNPTEIVFTPKVEKSIVEKSKIKWKDAIERSKNWAD